MKKLFYKATVEIELEREVPDGLVKRVGGTTEIKKNMNEELIKNIKSDLLDNTKSKVTVNSIVYEQLQ